MLPFPRDQPYTQRDRYVAYVSTDKMIYRTTEYVYVRAFILDSFTNMPCQNMTFGCIHLRILNPLGKTLLDYPLEKSAYGVLSYRFRVHEEAAGGTYKLTIYCKTDGTDDHEFIQLPGLENRLSFVSGEREFDVRVYEPPKFKKELQFVRKAYSPGDTVNAILTITRADGTYCDSTLATLTVFARVDGTEVFRSDAGAFSLDSTGRCYITFSLPETIDEGIGSLSCIVTEGVSETVTRTLPLVLSRLTDVQFFPEGGDLIAGALCGLYIEARTPTKDPLDFEAELVSILPNDEEVVEEEVIEIVRTVHEGRAFVEFRPSVQEDISYGLRVTKPPGVTELVPIPMRMKPQSSGVSLRLLDRESEHVIGDSIQFVLEYASLDHENEPEELNVRFGLFRREQLMVSSEEETFVTLPRGVEVPLSLDLTNYPKLNEGVHRLTIFVVDDNDNTILSPIAERLVFLRRKHQPLSLEVSLDREEYSPGNPVTITIRSVPPMRNIRLGITVTNDSVRKMIEKRRRSPRLPAMVLLENEVSEGLLLDWRSYFEFDDGLSSPDHRLDLLLGTQGWRRFVYKEGLVSAVVAADLDHPERIRRLLAIDDSFLPIVVDDDDEEEGEEEDEEDITINVPDELLDDRPPPQQPQQRDEGPVRGLNDFNIQKESTLHLVLRLRPNRPNNFHRTFAEYIHPPRSISHEDQSRNDFLETLYFRGCARTDGNGVYSAQFGLNDDVTSFAVVVDAVTPDGVLGYSDTTLVKSIKPFFVMPKMPLELSVLDRVLLPVGVCSNLNSALEATLRLEGPDLDPVQLAVALAERERKSVYVEFVPSAVGKISLTLGARTSSGGFTDSMTKVVPVLPYGTKCEECVGGMLEPDGEAVRMEFVIPEQNYVPDSISTEASVFPSSEAFLDSGFERLIRRPSGCFEQTSSTMYPMIMVIRLIEAHRGDLFNPDLLARANQYLASGYERLASYEVQPTGGFEWFGRSPAHEALTSMGLFQFADLKTVFPDVDMAMVDRAKKWLLGRLRPDHRGFNQSATGLDLFGSAPPELTNAYICYALSRSDPGIVERNPGIADLVQLLESQARGVYANDSYFISLVALALFLNGMHEESATLVESLAEFQDGETGAVPRARTSITCSRGSDLLIETTSLAVLNFCNIGGERVIVNASKGIEYLSTQCDGGSFGSTQATVLALQANLKYGELVAVTKTPGTIELQVNGGTHFIALDDAEALVSPRLAFSDFETEILTGRNVITLSMTDGFSIPYSINVTYRVAIPPSQEDQTTLSFSSRLIASSNPLVEGDVAEIEVDLANLTTDGLAMTVVECAMPAGLQARVARLKELKRAGTVDSFEMFGARKVVFYWRCLSPEERKLFTFDVVAEIPGEFRSEGSRAYLYYGGASVSSAGIDLEIVPRG